MRVIAGSAKGMRLHDVPGGTRPLAERAREGLFSSLGREVIGAHCADVYAGTGAIGIEALSRGAASCYFVDASRGAIRAIQANLKKTGLLGGLLSHQDALVALSRVERTFDLVFLDPPYDVREDELRRVLARSGELARGGTLVLTRPKQKASTDVIPIDWPVARLLRYGDARILVCREER